MVGKYGDTKNICEIECIHIIISAYVIVFSTFNLRPLCLFHNICKYFSCILLCIFFNNCFCTVTNFVVLLYSYTEVVLYYLYKIRIQEEESY